jgi:[ribosomal protein S18]-alanine N-acetyltransferase
MPVQPVPTSHAASTYTLQKMGVADIDPLLAIEQTAYSHPWTRGNFIDAIAAGYEARLLVQGTTLIGYFVAMLGVQEAHLLNITIAPAHQQQGWAKVLLKAMAQWAQAQGAQSIWLEVRNSNTRAIAVYTAYGFAPVGIRKNYYPISTHTREDAVVMCLTV